MVFLRISVFNRIKHLHFLVIGIFCLCGCETVYQPADSTHNSLFASGGYEDKQLGPGHYAITYTGATYSEVDTLKTLFHKRAEELCGGKDYTSEVVDTSYNKSQPYVIGYTLSYNSVHFPQVSGTVKCSGVTR